MAGTKAHSVHLVERVVLVVAIALGAFWLAFSAWMAVRSLRQKFVDGIYSIQLGITGDPIPGPTSGTATVSDAWLGTAWANISDLSPTAATLVVTQHIVGFALFGTIIGTGIVLCIRTLLGRPFARSMTVALWVVALTLMVVGSGAELLASVVPTTLTTEALGTGTPPAPYSGGSSLSFPGSYLMAGAGVAVIAIVFGAGARLRRDSEGLI